MRHRRRGVKREHSVIGGFAAVYERLARLPGVLGIIPGRIANNPTHHPGLVLKAETATGFKLFAKTTTSLQEVFLIARDGARPGVLTALQPLLARPAGPRPAPGAGGRPRPPRPGGARARGWRNPGILPEAPARRPLVRYTAEAASTVRAGMDETTRRRLLLLRLRRARWKHRFGVPLRRAARPRRRPPAGR